MKYYKSREKAEHDDDREPDILILPCENPCAIQETCYYIEISYIFIHEFIFLSFSSKVIHERHYWKYEKKSIYDAPDRESEANRRKEIIIFIWELLRSHPAKREGNRERIESHHKNIGDEVEKGEFHSEIMIGTKKGMQSIPLVFRSLKSNLARLIQFLAHEIF